MTKTYRGKPVVDATEPLSFIVSGRLKLSKREGGPVSDGVIRTSLDRLRGRRIVVYRQGK